MKLPKALIKEITPDELENHFKYILEWLQSLNLNEWYLTYDKMSKKRHFVYKQSILGQYGNKKYSRELTVKEQFLIKIS